MGKNSKVTTYKVVGTGWKVKKENNDNNIQCSFIKSPTVFIEYIPRCKIDLLMTKYPHQEWLGYMVGRVSEKENYFVEDLSIPPHEEVSWSSAEAEPFHIPEGCIGIIHSHHSMGAFHSGTDKAYVDKNFPISITVANGKQGLEFDAISYQVTPCGKGTSIKVQVKYVQPSPPFDTEAFMEEAEKNIDKGKFTYKPVSYQGNIVYPGMYPRSGLPYSDYTDYVTDGEGKPVSQKELDAHYREIWGD